MIKFLKTLGALLLAIVVAYVFLIDSVIKTQLEREGTRALQAPLTIGQLTFHLFPTSLTLRDVQIGNAQRPSHNLVQADALTMPLALRDLLAHKLIVDTIAIHGVRFQRPRGPLADIAPASTQSATGSTQMHEALQRVQQMLNHPLASNTIDPDASITGAVLAAQFKPLLTQIAAALQMLTTTASPAHDWQILARHVDVDGALELGQSALRFVGRIENITPQPAAFDVATQIDLRNAADEPATLRVSGDLDKRKLAQVALRFDLDHFAIAHWELCADPELKIVIVGANASVQALLSSTGNQFDLQTLLHFQDARFDIANGDSDVARVIADVWRRTTAFDINLQASGDVINPVLKINSSLDVPLANALQQLQPASAFPPAALPVSP